MNALEFLPRFLIQIVLPGTVIVFIGFLVTQGLKALLNLFGKDFSGKWAAFVAVVVASVVVFLEGLLGLVPPDMEPIFTSALQLIAMILGMFGFHYTYKNILKP